MIRRSTARCKGQVMVLFIVFITFLIGFATLGFDLAYIYVVKAQTVMATDAAALAAIRAFPKGAAATNAAANYTFAANFPSNKLMVNTPTITTPTTTNADGLTTLTVTGNVGAPTFFGRWFGRNEVSISTTTTTARRDRNVILVLDRSDSLGATFRNDVIPAAKDFVDSFSNSSDQVGLVLFSRVAYTVYPPQTNFKASINAILDNPSMTTRPGTNHTQGLYEGFRYLADLVDLNKSKKQNELVFFTDGRAYSWPARWNVDTGSDGCPSNPIDAIHDAGTAKRMNLFQLYPSNPSDIQSNPSQACPGWSGNYIDSMDATYALPNMNGLVITSVPFDSAEDLHSIDPEAFVGHIPGASNNNERKEWRRQLAENQVDNLARAIRRTRADGMRIRVHVVGYENSDPGDPRVLNPEVLHRLANCEGCAYASATDLAELDPDPSYQFKQQRGIYVEAATAGDLLSRFREVSSFIARIVK